ncbi:sensor histidine kinase [Brevibacterium oceani]|uniref:sensor histidine kinase n=1 Tax=Brevibacterium oceani TaxID=358099 RepID=UPI001FE991DA|nr:histidine kinase [Brevibacterium oceani]
MAEQFLTPTVNGPEPSATAAGHRGRVGPPVARPRTIPRAVRIAGSILIGVVLFLIGFFASAMAVTAAPWAFSDGELNDAGIVTVLLLVPVWGLVFLRRRWPWALFVAGAVLTTGWGDAFLLLIGLFHLVIRASIRQAIIASAVGFALVAGSTVRMCLAPARHNPFGLFFLPDPAQVTGAEAAVPPDDSLLAMTIMTIAASTIGLGVSLGVGALLRRTRRMRSVESLAERQTLRNESLTAKLARQSERELLARELHDTLSHRLSVISLHSGALEIGAETDPEVASTAAALRQEARASLEDLRHLVGGVREGDLTDPSTHRGSVTPPNRASLQSIPQLIASVQTTGTIIRPSIIIQDVEHCPTGLDRAIYRIVQEALTNAMKHAPNSPVNLSVSVSAAGGARIVAANPITASPGPVQVPPRPQFAPDSTASGRPVSAAGSSTAQSSVAGGSAAQIPSAQVSGDLASSGSGAGLVGIRERVDLYGGSATIGARGGEFLVDVSFPPFPPGT